MPKPSFTIAEDHINIRVKLTSRAEADWMIANLTRARDAIFPPKETYRVILMVTGERKINVIKELRDITGIGLKEAKDMSEAVRPVVVEGIEKVTADIIAERLRDQGAVVDVIPERAAP